MQMTSVQALITILAIAAGTQFTRWLPFWLFPEKKDPPAVVLYLGKVLPAAMFALLVVYCLRGLPSHGTTLPDAASQLVAVAATVAMHVWRRNMMWSIAVGTACYMLLIRM